MLQTTNRLKRGVYRTTYGNAAYVSGPSAKTAYDLDMGERIPLSDVHGRLHQEGRTDRQSVLSVSGLTVMPDQTSIIIPANHTLRAIRALGVSVTHRLIAEYRLPGHDGPCPQDGICTCIVTTDADQAMQWARIIASLEAISTDVDRTISTETDDPI